jgi:hypothetical protein
MSKLVEMGLGLALVFFLVSIAVSILAEWVSAILAKRGKLLWKAIEMMLGPMYAANLCDHSLIQSLTRTTWFDKVVWLRRPKPSYMPARTFSAALLGVLQTTSGEDLFTAFDKMSSDPLKTALQPLLTQAAGDLEQAQRNVEHWFDTVMDRATGWYKRWNQQVLLVLGLGVAMVVGADTLHISKELWRNEALRAGLAETATVIGNDESCREAVTNSTGDATHAARKCLDRFESLTEGMGLPLTHFGDEGQVWWWQLLGYLLTAMAASFGAPFWFDLLGRLTKLRSAGARPQPSAPGEPTTASPDAPAPGA